MIRTKSVILAGADHHNCFLAIIGDSIGESILSRVNFAYRIFEQEAGVIEYAKTLSPAMVVFDMLHICEDAFGILKQMCKTVSISPVFNFQYHVDASFSRTRYESDMKILKEARHFRGLDYATIGPYCERINEEVYSFALKKTPLSVAICMGGADSMNMTFKILEIVRHISIPLLFWVMVGEGYTHSYQALIDCVKKDTNHEIIVAKTTQSMWRILSGCTFAILACGITTYEAVYAGLPSINIVSSPDQIFLIKELEEMGVVFSLQKQDDQFENKLKQRIVDINESRELLMNMHKRGKVLIDGLGAFRIRKELHHLLES